MTALRHTLDHYDRSGVARYQDLALLQLLVVVLALVGMALQAA